LVESALIPFHRTILMTLYATGAKRAELAHLKSTKTSRPLVGNLKTPQPRIDPSHGLIRKMLHNMPEIIKNLYGNNKDSIN
jgi:hypothetical protein